MGVIRGLGSCEGCPGKGEGLLICGRVRLENLVMRCQSVYYDERAINETIRNCYR